jgi:hypothetical protein
VNCRHLVGLATALLLACSSPPTAPSSPLRIELVSGGGQAGVAGYPLPEPVVVKLVDDRGNPVPGVELAATSTGLLAQVESDNWTTDDDGLVTLRWRMGASHDGETITLTTSGGSHAEQLVVSATGGSRQVRKIAGGLNRYCIITMDDRLGCWRGLALDPFPSPLDEIPTVDFRPVTEKYLDVAVGSTGGIVSEGDIGCAVVVDGSISCFGAEGGLESMRTIGAGGFRKIFANTTTSRRFFCALDEFGEAWCWGDNLRGQLGDGTTEDATTPRRVETEARFTELVLGDAHTCGLDGEGAAWCWGYNGNGATGVGTFEENSLTPVQVATPQRFVSLAVLGGEATCGLNAGGQWWCWGNRFYLAEEGVAAEPGLAANLTSSRLAAPNQVTLVSDASGQAHWWGDLYPTIDLVVVTSPRPATLPFQVNRFAQAVKDRAVCGDTDGQGRWLCADLLWLWYGNPDDDSGSIGARPLVHGVP